MYRRTARGTMPPAQGRPGSPMDKLVKDGVLAGDSLPLPLWLTNRVFALIFAGATYYLIKRWRLKLAHDIPLHYITLGEAFAMMADMSAFVYLIGFFGIAFVQTSVRSDAGSEGEPEGADDEPLVPPAPQLRSLGGRPPLPPSARRVSGDSGAPGARGVPDADLLDDESLAEHVAANRLAGHSLEKSLGCPNRAVRVRRRATEIRTGADLRELPLEGCDYRAVVGQCAENVIGHVSVPLGVAGPLILDGEAIYVPMATTEGALIASTNRGMKALGAGGGAYCEVLRDGMTRAPVVRMPNASRAAALKRWVEARDNYLGVAHAFDSTSSFARLQSITCQVAGRSVYMRFCSSTGDAMGMNMVSKGVNAALKVVTDAFPEIEVISISGNVCSDKKPSSVNWVEGRGKSVVCEAVIPGDAVRAVLKTSVAQMVELNTVKNLTGSAVAGSIGGFNAHAANMVAAVFLATGQDVAQVVESSNCLTLMEAHNEGQDLMVSVTMPSLEVGTVGGGTGLPAQGASLGLLGVRGPNVEEPGANAAQLARVVAATVLAGEVSLMAALTSGDLVRSHMKYNRSLNSLSTLTATGGQIASQADASSGGAQAESSSV